MATIYILVPLALVFVAVAVGVFIWATKNGQFDDLETPAHRILFDDELSHAEGLDATIRPAEKPDKAV